MAFEIRRVRGGTVAVTRVEVERLRIGRGTNTDLSFDDAAVSLEHAALGRDGGAWVLTDCDSVTGTWVNGRRIETAQLQAGDLLEIGEHRVRVVELGETPVLEVAVPEREPEVQASSVHPQDPVDHAAAYRLRQGWLSRSGLTLTTVAFTLAVVVALAALGRSTAFRPGPVSEAHARTIGANACLDCHQPWRGPADSRCTQCHQSHPIHQPTQARTPRCGSCHTEHRRLRELDLVPDSACVSCHRDLQVETGATPRFASRVTGFGTDHPELAIWVRGRRLPLSDPEARTSDPGTLGLNHQLHLKPGLLGPDGRVTLECESCHALGGADGHLKPVDFELHCRSCHRLGFDLKRPGEEAPHGDPKVVHNYLLEAFSRDPAFDALSLEERRRRIIQNPARRPSLPPGVIQQVIRTELALYQNACSKCHQVDLTTSPPTVAPPAVTADWLPFARFPHARHGASVGLTCTDCHGDTTTSTRTADVLLPGVEICRGCHGAGNAAARGARETNGVKVPSDCVDCHTYHTKTETAAETVAFTDATGDQLDEGSNSRSGLSRAASR